MRLIELLERTAREETRVSRPTKACSVSLPAPRLIGTLAVSVMLLLASGCASFHPRIEQPRKLDGTFPTAVARLRDTHEALSRRIRSQEMISGITNLTTFVGLGGAGVSAIFKGSKDLILGLVAVGSTSSVTGGLYANAAQSAVYSNGLDAVVCIENAYGALITAQANLNSGLKDIDNSEKAITDYVTTHTITAEQLKDKDDALAAADAAVAQAHHWQGQVNLKAGPQLISSLTGVITTVNNQLRSVVPDAAAFARAGSGLQNVIVAAQSPPPGASGGNKILRAADDPHLTVLLQTLATATQSVTEVTAVPTQTADVTCKVADATPVAPLSVVLPSGTTEVDIASGGSATYQINGGSQPYMSVQWSPSAPACFSASILSPSTLQFSGKASCTTDNGKSFNFDIYDVVGHHLSTPMVLKVGGS